MFLFILTAGRSAEDEEPVSITLGLGRGKYKWRKYNLRGI
jgi:hypothetical protein